MASQTGVSFFLSFHFFFVTLGTLCNAGLKRAKPLKKVCANASQRDPSWLSSSTDTIVSDRIYDDFLRLLFLHDHRETSALPNDRWSWNLELPVVWRWRRRVVSASGSCVRSHSVVFFSLKSNGRNRRLCHMRNIFVSPVLGDTRGTERGRFLHSFPHCHTLLENSGLETRPAS
jgi:hypothetical protein